MNFEIEWNKIVTNAISALLTIVFVGAASIVWTKANGIEGAINEATKGLIEQTEKLDKTILVIQKEMVDDKKSRREEIESLQKQIFELQKELLLVNEENSKPLEIGNINVTDLYPESILDKIDITPIDDSMLNGTSNFVPLPKLPKDNFLMQQIHQPQQFLE